jgi:hypothetical protein
VAAHEPFKISCSELNKGLEEIPLFGVVSSRIPEYFEDLMAFPPVGVIIQVDPIQIVV